MQYTFTSAVLALVFMMMPGSSSSPKPTEVKNHSYGKDGPSGIEEITEVTWNNIKSMHIKAKLPIRAETQMLPISVYHDIWKVWMSTKQHLTRIASLAILWTPTSSKFNEMATLIVVDERFKDDYIKSGKKSMLKSGKLNVDLVGNTITAVPFDPNFQQFITGSLDFATDTMDINKIKFYISFPDTRMAETGSTAGYLDMSWKTMPDENGVYEKVQWDVFTFEKRLPAEIENMAGKNSFMKIKSYLDKKYNERREALQQLDDYSNALVYGTDQGLNRIENKLNEDTASSSRLLRDTSRRIRAIQLKEIHSELSDAKSKLTSALAGSNVEEISDAKEELISVYKKNDLPIPIELDDEEGFVTFKASEPDS